ncbi:hypothetical protein [Nocardiopsis baichengensis]|uniref:hypothetical protein n=1 Tax=Nocardiopsis baichengensis TaxID=280240 RepID=UPI00034504E2|nr:hypothetical protein [Nocardiopsis baichengensis]
MGRRTGRTLPRLVSASAALLLLLAGCGLFGTDGQSGKSGEGGEGGATAGGGGEGASAVEPITSRPTNSWELPGGRAEVSLHRVDGDHMVARMSLTNEDGNKLHFASHLAEGFGENEDYPWDRFSGVAWLDPEGRTLHRPFYADEGACLCSSSDGSYLNSEGETWEGHAVLEAPPEDVDALTVVTHIALPFVDVPVEDGAPEVDVALTGLRAVTPSTALLTYELHNPNDGTVSVNLDMYSEQWMAFRYHATHAVSLSAPDGDRTSHPLRVHPPDDRSDPYCFCSSTAGINLGSTRLAGGATGEYYAMLPITPGTTVTDVTVGPMGTMEGVAVAH